MSTQPAPVSGRSFKLALVQLGETSSSKSENLQRAKSLVERAAKGKDGSSGDVDLVVLPECFNSLYGTRECWRPREALWPRTYANDADETPQNTLTRTPKLSMATLAKVENRQRCFPNCPRASRNG